MCEGASTGLTPGAKVTLMEHTQSVTVSEQLLGRVIDGAGRPLDKLAPVVGSNFPSGGSKHLPYGSSKH
jgi:flagellar biosynthesis/type III secretory pathway ATPase